MITMNKEMLLEELIRALPSKKLLDVVNFCAIKVGNEYFVLKDRYRGNGGYVAKSIDENKLMDYKQINDDPYQYHTYKEFLTKNILIDKRILYRSGLGAIIEYLEAKESNND